MPKHGEGCKDGSAWASVCVRERSARMEGVEVRVEVRAHIPKDGEGCDDGMR
jgi:hypothetical protein